MLLEVSNLLNLLANLLDFVLAHYAKKPQDTRLWRRFKQVEKLPAKERRQLLQLIDAFLEREKLRGNGAE